MNTSTETAIVNLCTRPIQEAAMWRELLRRWFPDGSFAEPASADRIHEVEAALGVTLPEELAGVLRACDGVFGSHGLGLIWPSARIVADNLAFRANVDFAELYMPFDPLLFFADAGNGDQFAFAITAGKIRRPDIFPWDHEDDTRKWVAPSLAKYLEWWSSGDLRL
jgi:SMI1-KNR4 cell-wall